MSKRDVNEDKYKTNKENLNSSVRIFSWADRVSCFIRI